MKKFLLNIFLVLLLFIFLPKPASADLVNPEYYIKTCSPGEMEVQCRYESTQPFGPKTYNECAKYENNPNYRFLVGEGHSFGGSQKYCFKAALTGDFIGYYIKVLLPLLLITLLLEIPIFLVFGFRGRRALFTVLSTNLISVPLFNLATIFLPFSGLVALIIMELIVVIFEAVFIKLMLKEIAFRRILIYSFVANAVSAILGYVILRIISGFLMV